MPEYLAPGVYVEETSFRSRPLEGVGTSTTAFVGPTRRGPIDDTPEIVTSVGDFERVYGGLEDLELGGQEGINHIAHAVRAFFDNGGARLYVARVFAPALTSDGKAASNDLASGTRTVRFVARFPGAALRGRVDLVETAQPATWRTLQSAPVGSMARIGTDVASRPARLVGIAGPYRVASGAVLTVRVGTTPHDITFTGGPATAAGTPLPATITLSTASVADRTLRLTIDGREEQAILLPDLDRTGAEVAAFINERIRFGNATLDGAGSLVLASDGRGSATTLVVQPCAVLNLAASDTTGTGNVPNLDAVTIAVLNTLLTAATTGVGASADPLTGALRLTTDVAAAAASLTVVTPAAGASAHAAFGLPLDAPATGADGSTAKVYVKQAGGDYTDVANAPLAETASTNARLLSLGVTVYDASGAARTYEDLGYAPTHPRAVGAVLTKTPARRADQLDQIVALEVLDGPDAFEIRDALLSVNRTTEDADGDGTIDTIRASVPLDAGGDDGSLPGAAHYRDALARLGKLEDISIVAAPGASAFGDSSNWLGIREEVLKFVERRRSYQIAVLDTRPDSTVGDARDERGSLDSTRAAIYYPWIVVANPLARPGDAQSPREIALPPSGFMCGIYARNDASRGVHKVPANEVVLGALRFERNLTTGEQEVLNPLGVNCLRSFAGRGHRVWGGRTSCSDPEWKYVSVRRYFNYVEASIDRGTQWAVFEPNGEPLWRKIRESLDEFFYAEWRNGALLGTSPKEAYFVRVDRSTMTQSDLDSGRLVCEIGVAVIKPAEFVIFRIGQKTSDARN